MAPMTTLQVRHTFFELVHETDSADIRVRCQSWTPGDSSSLRASKMLCNADAETASTVSGESLSPSLSRSSSGSLNGAAHDQISGTSPCSAFIKGHALLTAGIGQIDDASQGLQWKACIGERKLHEYDAKGLGSGEDPKSQAKKRPSRKRADRTELRLAECLEQLQRLDPLLILRVNGMGRRGATPAVVQSYFESRYGDVDLLLANPPTSNNIMGFLVMSRVHDASLALGDGPDVEVLPGGSVKVRSFEHQAGRTRLCAGGCAAVPGS